MRCDPDYIQEQLQNIGCGGQSEPTIEIVGKFVAEVVHPLGDAC